MSDKSRRKLLKSIAAGSGAIVAGKSLPETWSRPVVDSVMLPAHAQTSQIVEYFVASGAPDSYIGSPDPDGRFTVCVSIIDSTSAAVTVQGSQNRSRRSGTAPLGTGVPGVTSVVATGPNCGTPGCFDAEVVLSNQSDSSITVQFTDGNSCGNNDGWVMTIPAAACGGFAALEACT